MDVSAVCQYQIGDVKKVFEGSYKEYREASQRWGRYSGAVPAPRPGSVRNREPRTGAYDIGFLVNANISRQPQEARKESIILKCRGCVYLFFVNYCITKGEMSGQRRHKARGREGSRNG